MKKHYNSILLTVLMLIACSGFIHAQTLNEGQGEGSLQSITTGDYNTAFGDSSGSSLKSNHYNTFFGYQAG